MKKIGIFGYGSLINLESASRTLQRKVSTEDVFPSLLKNYKRTWTYWADVYSKKLEKSVKGVFLNIEEQPMFEINGIVYEINSDELIYLKHREKNYNCVEVGKHITLEGKNHFSEIYTFIGANSNLVLAPSSEYYIFQKYIDILSSGLNYFSEGFQKKFIESTLPMSSPILEGDYIFEDTLQQKSR